jgi:hypothetical protein
LQVTNRILMAAKPPSRSRGAYQQRETAERLSAKCSSGEIRAKRRILIKPPFHNHTKRDSLSPLYRGGGEGGITQNSLRAVLTLRASPVTRLGAKCSLSRIWSNLRFSTIFFNVLIKNASTREALLIKWRRRRDSNPRYAINVYSLSRGAPSATRPLLRGA